MNRNQSTGFTLIELMIAVAIVGIILVVAVPSFTAMNQDSAFTTSANAFIGALKLARTEAVKRGSTISVEAGSATTWGDGFSVFADTNGDGDQDTGEETLRIINAFNGPTLSGTQTSFSFGPDGMLDTADTLTVCDSRTGETGRRIFLQLGGTTQIDTDFTCP
mgnify:FL=1